MCQLLVCLQVRNAGSRRKCGVQHSIGMAAALVALKHSSAAWQECRQQTIHPFCVRPSQQRPYNVPFTHSGVLLLRSLLCCRAAVRLCCSYAHVASPAKHTNYKLRLPHQKPVSAVSSCTSRTAIMQQPALHVTAASAALPGCALLLTSLFATSRTGALSGLGPCPQKAAQ